MVNSKFNLSNFLLSNNKLKLVCWGLAASACFYLSKNQLQNLFVVLALGHFLSSAYFQKKPRNLSLKRLVFLSLVGGFAFYAVYQHTIIMMFATVFWFLFHFYLDELHLHEENFDIWNLFAFFPLLILISAQFWRKPLGEFSILLLLIISLASLLRFSSARLWLLITFWTVCGFSFLDQSNSIIITTLGFLILIHYLRWYLVFPVRKKNLPTVVTGYFLKIIIINLIVVGLYFLANFLKPNLFLYKITFDIKAFYAWTFLHMASTMRTIKSS